MSDTPVKATKNQAKQKRKSRADGSRSKVDGSQPTAEGPLPAAEGSQPLDADTLIKQVAQDITQEVQATAQEQVDQAKSIYRLFLDWLQGQLQRLSKAVLAIVLAALVSLAMPILVKIEMLDEFKLLSDEINGISNFTETKLDASLQSVLQGQLNSVSQGEIVSDNLNDLSVALDQLAETYELGGQRTLDQYANITNANTDVLKQQYAEFQQQQMTRLNQIEQSILTLQVPEQPAVFSDNVKAEIKRYLDRGNALKRLGDLPSQEVNAWIGEAYYFVSLLPPQYGDLSVVKFNLERAYLGEGNLNSRLNESLMILSAIERWSGV